MTTSDNLYKKCARFEKIAAEALTFKQNLEINKLMTSTLNHLGKDYLPSAYQAKVIFDEINNNK